MVSQEILERYAPIVHFHPFERYFPCSLEWLLEHCCLRHTRSSLRILRPTRRDLLAHWQADHPAGSTPYLDIASSGYGGHLESAPSYVTVQEWDSCYEITYLMLYAYQGPQTARWHLSRQPYDCLVRDFGRHQGDLEWVSLSLDKDRLQPLEIGLQAHGEVRMVPWSRCPRHRDHPLIRAALHGHACALQGEPDRVVHRRLGGILSICDLFCDGGQVWRPSPRRLGLDEKGEPIGDEVWAKFQGRIGRRLDNHFRRLTRLDGEAVGLLPRLLGRFVRLAEVRGWLPPSIRQAEGTPGPGDPGRWFMHGQRRSGAPLRQCPY
ncbi:MAG: Vps62-related protein [Candidatus Eremiobacteraeota bacterium]|nr:Vps62-related protein [Candidatus Eremiobacteraeota bacterium]MCW5867327.1 Vps62-related protein [Candidatus Eremiobacteraeota bacterium]